jgi:predicted transcriptional regulator
MQTNSTKDNTITIDDVESQGISSAYQILTVPLVATLLSKNKTQAEIARLFGKSDQAVSQFIQRNETDLAVLKNFEDVTVNALKHSVCRIVNSVEESDIKKAGLVGKFTAAGIGIEKVRLLQDKSTSNLSVRSVVDDIRKRKEELQAKKCEPVDNT